MHVFDDPDDWFDDGFDVDDLPEFWDTLPEIVGPLTDDHVERLRKLGLDEEQLARARENMLWFEERYFDLISGGCGSLKSLGRIFIDKAGRAVDWKGRSIQWVGELEDAATKWYKSTFDSVERSILYHLGEHGGERSIKQYTKDAQKLWKKYMKKPNKFGKRVTLRDGTQGVKVTFKKNGVKYQGLYTPDGKIVTYYEEPY